MTEEIKDFKHWKAAVRKQYPRSQIVTKEVKRAVVEATATDIRSGAVLGSWKKEGRK